MIVVGLDISMRCTGVAVLVDGKVVDSDVVTSTKDDTDREAAHFIIDRLKLIGEEHHPHVWAVERHQFGGATGTRMQWLIGFVEGSLGLIFDEIHNMTAKRLIGAKPVLARKVGKTVRKKRTKDVTLDAVHKLFGWDIFAKYYLQERRWAVADAIAVAYAAWLLRREVEADR